MPPESTVRWDLCNTCLVIANRPARFKLLQQSVMTIDVEVAAHAWRTGVRPSSSDTDGVVTLRNDRIAILRDHVEIARADGSAPFGSRLGRDECVETAESNERSSLYRREIEIKLEPLYPFGYGLWASADCCMGPAKEHSRARNDANKDDVT